MRSGNGRSMPREIRRVTSLHFGVTALIRPATHRVNKVFPLMRESSWSARGLYPLLLGIYLFPGLSVNQFFSRHSRNAMRARWSINQRLLSEMESFLQISL